MYNDNTIDIKEIIKHVGNNKYSMTKRKKTKHMNNTHKHKIGGETEVPSLPIYKSNTPSSDNNSADTSIPDNNSADTSIPDNNSADTSIPDNNSTLKENVEPVVEPVTTKTVIEHTTSLAEAIVFKIINILITQIGLEPDHLDKEKNEILRKLQVLKQVIMSEEGQAILKEIKDISSDYGEKVIIPVLVKFINDFIKEFPSQSIINMLKEVVMLIPVANTAIDAVLLSSDAVNTGLRIGHIIDDDIFSIAGLFTGNNAESASKLTSVYKKLWDMVLHNIQNGLNTIENTTGITGGAITNDSDSDSDDELKDIKYTKQMLGGYRKYNKTTIKNIKQVVDSFLTTEKNKNKTRKFKPLII